ncbi:MAG: thioredoxin family protein [Candidatus Hydrogenedentes bacterium]|nr:thioredoxin family protein [Candidatus Hydrogenedentota bacterium]
MKNIKVLGPGCMKCIQLYENAQKAAEELKIEYNIEKVTDIQEIMEYGIMLTPALVVNGEVLSSGKVLDKEEIKKLLSK